MSAVPRETDNSLDPKGPRLHAKLMQDVNDVFVFQTKRIESFPPDYQIQLRNTYRFFGVRYQSDENFNPKISPETQDLV